MTLVILLPGKPLIPSSWLRAVLGAALLGFGVGPAVGADEAPPRPHVLLLVVEGLEGVGAPATGLEQVLFDPEVRARATPNLGRLVERGARYDRAFASDPSSPIDLDPILEQTRTAEGYRAEAVSAGEASSPPHRDTRARWKSPEGDTLRRWARREPRDTSIAGWESLAESQEAVRVATAVSEAIRDSEATGPRRCLLARLAFDSPTPAVLGVFFDRFPLDQVRLPESPDARRALAERMGAYDLDPSDLSPDDESAWREAIQAWLAAASSLDYAVGEILDALDQTDTPWAVVLVATPAEAPPRHAVRDVGARADLMIASPSRSQPSQRVGTPVGLNRLQATLLGLMDESASPSEGLLAWLAPASDRYDRVVLTTADGAYGVRSHRFRLIHQSDGSQTLYDLEKDPEGFYDLLDADNTAKVESFGMTSTQVEAVRRWHTGRLYYRLAERDTPEEFLNELAGLAAIDPDTAQPPPIVPGDYNRDGVVNAADSTVWRDQNGEEVPVGSGADGDHDGRVDDEDQVIWRSNYGRRASAP